MINRKRGILYENIIFLVLNLIFFVVLFIFIVGSVGSRSLDEQRYAKQVALLIDRAKPDTTITLHVEDLDKYDKNIKEMIQVKDKEKKVVVYLGGGSGYSYQYFSDYDVGVEIEEKQNIFRIKVK